MLVSMDLIDPVSRNLLRELHTDRVDITGGR